MSNKSAAIIFTLIGLMISFIILILTKRGYTEEFLLWIASIGIWGHVVIFIVYIISSFPIPVGTT